MNTPIYIKNLNANCIERILHFLGADYFGIKNFVDYAEFDVNFLPNFKTLYPGLAGIKKRVEGKERTQLYYQSIVSGNKELIKYYHIKCTGVIGAIYTRNKDLILFYLEEIKSVMYEEFSSSVENLNDLKDTINIFDFSKLDKFNRRASLKFNLLLCNIIVAALNVKKRSYCKIAYNVFASYKNLHNCFVNASLCCGVKIDQSMNEFYDKKKNYHLLSAIIASYNFVDKIDVVPEDKYLGFALTCIFQTNINVFKLIIQKKPEIVGRILGSIFVDPKFKVIPLSVLVDFLLVINTPDVLCGNSIYFANHEVISVLFERNLITQIDKYFLIVCEKAYEFEELVKIFLEKKPTNIEEGFLLFIKNRVGKKSKIFDLFIPHVNQNFFNENLEKILSNCPAPDMLAKMSITRSDAFDLACGLVETREQIEFFNKKPTFNNLISAVKNGSLEVFVYIFDRIDANIQVLLTEIVKNQENTVELFKYVISKKKINIINVKSFVQNLHEKSNISVPLSLLEYFKL